jgi:hypothetical protein
MDGLDPETRKALKIPQVRQALEQEFAKADQARTHLESTIQAGQQMLQATVAALAPQLDGMPIEHWPQAIQMLSQVDPVRGQLVADTLQRWSAMQQADQQIKAQAAHEQAQEFRAFKAAEDAKLAESLGGDRGLVQQYAPKVQSYFKSLGMTEAEMWALANDRTANSALGQQVLLDALRFREIMAAPKAVPTREIPAVQRPGTKSPIRNNDSSTRLRGLEAQFASAAGHDAVRLAAEITQTRRASRRG